MKFFLFPVLSILLLACNSSVTEHTVEQLNEELASVKLQLEEAKAAAEIEAPGLVHNVFFWLKEDLNPEEEAAFLEGVKSLKTISTIKSFYLGPPAPTEARDVVDNSFSYALLIHFDDVKGQDAYQVDPIHLQFVEDHKDKWTKVIVYDNTLVE